MNLPYLLFKKVTKNFSEDWIIGEGGFGKVYKGELDDGELIAVKMLHPLQALDEGLFKNEVCNNLFKDGHPNIIGLLGYCDEIHSEFVEHHGEKVSLKHVYRGLCFRYFPCGSLYKHLVEESLASNWSTRYNIIKGICEGLNFLHGCKPPIYHLDLKPGNILLDNSMLPKLADFGLSRLFPQSRTQVTQQRIGTHKYMPPEYITRGTISSKSDVYSFGVVMIEIMVGYSLFEEMDNVTQFKHEVLTKWSSMKEPISEYQKEKIIHQVRTCVDTAMQCVDYDRENRPSIARILDTLNETETDTPRTQLEIVPLCPTIDLKNSLAETFKTIKDEMKNRTNLGANVEQVPNMLKTSTYVEEAFRDRETSSYVEEGVIIGRTEEKNKILSILSESSTKDMVILPIYGIGGIGKTTLAQLIFNDTQLQGYSRVWVYVSEKLNINTIGNSILSQLSKNTSHIADMQMLHNELANILSGRRVLIVLDDLWEQDLWELDKLKAMLRIGKGKRVIIVTTRDEGIAKNICSTDKNVPYKLEILTDEMCWTIIKQKTDFENQGDKFCLEQIGRDIAVRCGGVALAAQSIGYLLMSICTSDQWDSVRNSDIWNSEDASLGTHKVLASLRLSYSHMHRLLQSCFSYCAVFPKGHKILKYDLFYQWIALGLVQPSEIFDMIQVCEKYAIQLLGMSFLHHSKKPLDKHCAFFTMHDLVHDLARSVDNINKNGNVVASSYLYALDTDTSKKWTCPENIKALHLHGNNIIELPDGIFSPAKNILVLDIRNFKNLPKSVGKLKQLRYLSAQYIWIPDERNDKGINKHMKLKQQRNICAKAKYNPGWRYPKFINKLHKLNYLNLSMSSMKALPDSIGDMKGLMHLDLSYCFKLSELPLSFGDLKQLVYLNLSNCSVPISESWGGFTKLQYFNLSRDGWWSNYEVLPEVIGKLTKLQYLNLSSPNWFHETNALEEVFGKQTKLQYLNLGSCMGNIAEADIHRLLVGISTLYNLEHLDLSWSKELNSIPENIGNLTKLHTLNLSNCNIQRLPAWMAEMANLKIVNMSTLDECGSNLALLAAANPSELKIRVLEDVMSLEGAQRMKLIEKQDMYGLELEWTVGCHKSYVDDMNVLEKLVPPNTINRFHVTGYRSLSFPTNWLIGIGQYLPHVAKITLEDLPNCNNLPPLGQLRSLSELCLCRLDKIEELDTEDSCGELMFPELHRLNIISCPKLRINACVPRVMRNLYIEGSDNVLTSFGKSVSQSFDNVLTDLLVKGSTVPMYLWSLLQNVSSLQILNVRDCSDLSRCSPEVTQRLASLHSFYLKDDILTELPTWLLELTSLKRLTIRAPKLEKLSDSTRKMTGLRSLSLRGCGGLVSLPQWLGELTSLRELEILECKGIKYLPGSIRQLTELGSLCIDDDKMGYSLITKLFSSISADTDEINIYEYIASQYSEVDIEEHEEDINNHVTSADAHGDPDPHSNAVNTWTHVAPADRRVGVRHSLTRRSRLFFKWIKDKQQCRASADPSG